MKKKDQNRELEKIASGEAQLIIGTHSCVADTVKYKNLAIAIVDEEHKFGVAQRAKIVAKADQGIHKISMSATPIPRSLAQVIYGDAVQLEVIRSMPSGRKPVITGIAEDQRKILRFLLKEVRAVNLFVSSRGRRKPVNNFCWRGTTGIGKSTGCSMFAAILETPKLELTCSTNMEEQDFHSAFVPNSSLSQEKMFSELPDATTLLVNPKGAMRQCGVNPTAQVTSDDALKAYASVVASRSGGNHFNLVESDYITALSKGYIVEIQEFSRIRDSGVLVKLNKYDKAGAEITLSDGTRVRRAENAVTFWTDNVGYVSNRPVDQSVIRRFDYVIPYREMEHDEILDRVAYNADCQDYALLEKMYAVWAKVAEYCKENDITDGSTSITELESWASIVTLLGCDNDPDQMEHALMGCVIGKATSDIDTQNEIMEIARIEMARR